MTNTSDKRVVLCVDDESVCLAMRKMMLESHGYRVFTADNGVDAITTFALESVELVLLDYKMPGMNGDAVAKVMKELKPDVPILMLSAYVDPPGEILARVDKYLTKAEPTEVLLEAIAQLLTAHHQEVAARVNS